MSPRTWTFSPLPTLSGAPTFAVESTYATTIFRALSGVPKSLELGFNLVPFPQDLRFNADRETNGGAAIFPDGLAVFVHGHTMDKTQPLLWLPDKADFVPVDSWKKVYSQEKHQGYLAGG
jgi:hypothetical protein